MCPSSDPEMRIWGTEYVWQKSDVEKKLTRLVWVLIWTPKAEDMGQLWQSPSGLQWSYAGNWLSVKKEMCQAEIPSREETEKITDLNPV